MRLGGADTEGCCLPSPQLSCTQHLLSNGTTACCGPHLPGTGLQGHLGLTQTAGRFQPGVPFSASGSHSGLHYNYFNIDLLLSILLSQENKLDFSLPEVKCLLFRTLIKSLFQRKLSLLMLITSIATGSLNSELQNKTGYNKTCNLKITLKENPLPGCLAASVREACDS